MADTNETTTVYHVCSQEENLAKLNLLLLGNGHPEDGIAFKVLTMAETNKAIQSDISDIKGSIKNFIDMHQKTFDAAITATNAIEKYKAETEKYEAGVAAEKHARGLLIARWFQVITICIALSAAVIGYMKLKSDIDSRVPINTSVPANSTSSQITTRTYFYNHGKDGIF